MSLDPAGRHGEKDDVGAAARLLVRDEFVARRPRADHHLLAGRRRRSARPWPKSPLPPTIPITATASSTPLPDLRSRQRRNHNDGRDERLRGARRRRQGRRGRRWQGRRRARRCRARRARGRARPSSPPAARAAPCPPTSGETATTRLPASASRMPGTARIGRMETNGFEGARKTISASATASRTPGAGRRAFGALVADGEHLVRVAPPDEPGLEVELARRRRQEVRTGSSEAGRSACRRRAARRAVASPRRAERPRAGAACGRGGDRCRGRRA